MAKESFDIELRGQPLRAELTIRAPEPDVGLIGVWYDDLNLFIAETDVEVNWALSKAELEIIYSAVSGRYYDSHSDWD